MKITELNTLNTLDIIISKRTKNTAIFKSKRSGLIAFEFEGRILTWTEQRFLETFDIFKQFTKKVISDFIKENTYYYNKKNKLIKINKKLKNGRFSAWFTELTYDENGVSDLNGKFGPISNLDRIAD